MEGFDRVLGGEGRGQSWTVTCTVAMILNVRLSILS